MDLLGTDATKVAGAYSAFAGVLAGFVFAVMGYLLGSSKLGASQAEREDLETALSWAVIAFVGLSLASFLFALLSGEDRFGLPINPATGVGPTRIRPIVLDIVASGVLSVAILTLLLGLNWLFASDKVSTSLVIQLRVVEWLIGLLTLFYLDGAFLAVPVAQHEIATDDLGPLAQLGVILLLAITLGEIAGWLLRRFKGRQKQVARIMTQFLLLILFCTSAILFNFVDFANEAGSGTWHVSDYQWWGVSALGVTLFLCILNLPGGHTKEAPSPTS
jgi:cytochrome bd-type quinol oxidase subunit 2